ncbi:50S ribosomal protein L32 [Streptomyces andamanensis]|uniref:Large ribosomal subunit protein bL32 n=1 Tax=Streptomyces andamanensis TaxID=1565035 RepID=A0ABV8TJE0_9ACTN
MRKKPRARTRRRRAHRTAARPALVACADPVCGRPAPGHIACPHRGTCRGRRVLPPAP